MGGLLLVRRTVRQAPRRRRVFAHIYKMAGHSRGHRRRGRTHRHGLLPQRRRGERPAREFSAAAVVLARRRHRHSAHLPLHAHGERGHQRRHRLHPPRRAHTAYTGAGHLRLDRTDAPLRRLGGPRGRGAADRRRHRLEPGPALPPRRQGHAPCHALRHERGFLRPFRHAADGHNLCAGGHQRGRGVLLRTGALPHGGAHGLRCDPAL